jgi:hypothetical protein
VRGERSVLYLSALVAIAGLLVIAVVIGFVVLLDPVP